LIDSLIREMGDAIARNYNRWPILGVYQWPNSYVGQTYGEEEAFLRGWIEDRLEWINDQWGGLCIPTHQEEVEVIDPVHALKVYPNPSDLSHTYLSVNPGRAATLQLRLYDITGKLRHHSTLHYSGREAACSLPDLSYLPDGIYHLEVTDGNRIRGTCKLMKR
jgi:hypothetical protein